MLQPKFIEWLDEAPVKEWQKIDIQRFIQRKNVDQILNPWLTQYSHLLLQNAN